MKALFDPGSRRAMLVLALVAVLAYLPLIGWGLPHATSSTRVKGLAVDELLPLDALAEMHNTFVVSKADRNYSYPWWHYFTLAAAQAPYVAYLKISGQLSPPLDAYPFGMRDPVTALRDLTLLGRLVSVLMGAGVVVLAYCFSRTLWDFRTGILAACLTLLSYPHVYYSRVGNADIGLVFWSSLGLVAFATILKDGLTSSRAGWLGVFAGIALGTKDQALPVFLPLGLVLLLPHLNADNDGRYQIRPLVAGFVAACVSYAVSTGMLVDPERHFLHVYNLFFQPDELTWMPFYHPPLPPTAEGVLEMLWRTVWGLSAMASAPVLVAAAGGALIALRQAPRYLVLLLPLPVLFLILTLPTGAVVYRYLYPMTFILDAFAAAGLVWIGRRYSAAAMAILFGVAIVWRALVAADLSYAQYHETRALAAKWFHAHANSGDVIEFFGVEQYLPPLSADVVTRRVAGRERWKRETGHADYVLEYLKREGPRFVYVTPDHSSRPRLERSADCPPEVYAALLDGSAGYRLAAHFPTPTILPTSLARPPLDHPAVSPPVRIFERIPAAGASSR